MTQARSFVWKNPFLSFAILGLLLHLAVYLLGIDYDTPGWNLLLFFAWSFGFVFGVVDEMTRLVGLLSTLQIPLVGVFGFVISIMLDFYWRLINRSTSGN